MEITVTMLIAAIVIGITYSAFLIMSQSYNAYHKKSEVTALLVQLDQLLKKDFIHSDSIAKIQDGILFKTGTDSIKYEFQPNVIVRISTIIDTFKFKGQEINTLFENQPITEVSPLEQYNRIDELSLVILLNDEKIPYHYYKLYSSANLIERIDHAVN
jgi:Tfp pilus assembly protein PilE